MGPLPNVSEASATSEHFRWEPEGDTHPGNVPEAPATNESAEWVTAAAPPPERKRPWGVVLGAGIFALCATTFAVFSISRRASPEPIVVHPVQAQTPRGMTATEVLLHVKVSPPTAEVSLDGKRVDQWPARLPRSSQTHRLVVTALGFQTETRSFSAQESRSFDVRLGRASPPARTPQRGPAKKRVLRGPVERSL